MKSLDAQFSGCLLVNKPRGCTSHDAVQALRRKLGVRKIGHTGTLDPAAEGLLILLVGPATRRQSAFQRHDKAYEAVIRLGAQTATGDAEGALIAEAPVPELSEAAIGAALKKFEGVQQQRPPQYSALKVRGKPAYWWARRNQTVELAARSIEIKSLELLAWESPNLRCRVRCSAGTYVRSLAEDLAAELGTVGHLAALVRTEVGRWSLRGAVSLDWIRDAEPSAVAERLEPAPEA